MNLRVEQAGTVSVWIGRAASEEKLWSGLEVSFSEDGDFLGSDFSRTIGIDYYEDATREADFLTQPPPVITTFLKGISYEDILLPKLKAAGARILAGDNCFVLLYDIFVNESEQNGASLSLPGLSLRFLGSFKYAASINEPE